GRIKSRCSPVPLVPSSGKRAGHVGCPVRVVMVSTGDFRLIVGMKVGMERTVQGCVAGHPICQAKAFESADQSYPVVEIQCLELLTAGFGDASLERSGRAGDLSGIRPAWRLATPPTWRS